MTTKNRLTIVGALVAIAFTLSSRPVVAGECTVACVRAKQVCVNAMKQARLACKEDCKASRSSAGGGFIGCFGPCRDDFAAAKATCKAAFAECHEACIPGHGGGGGGGGNEGCVEQCGATGRSCLQGVKDTALQCGGTCQATARGAIAACRGSNAPLSCLMDAGRALATCLRGCVTTGVTDGGVCSANLRSCVTGCQGGGSPSGAFLP